MSRIKLKAGWVCTGGGVSAGDARVSLGLLFDSWCSAHGISPKKIKPDIQNIYGPLTYQFS